VIKTDGSAQPCCLYDEKEENVRKKSLKEIWFGKFFEDIRNSMREKKFSKYCSICNAGQVFENRRIRDELSWMKK
jgi:MoaA/NifB/PqqE/SkfB family radical SAM enzyme